MVLILTKELMKLNTTINNDFNLFLFSFIVQYSLKTVPNLITPYMKHRLVEAVGDTCLFN